MFGENKPEVLVVGAGPVGQFAALALAKRGVSVRIVDRGIWPCAQSYALALHPQSLQLLREYGLLDSVLGIASTVDSLALYEGGQRRAELRLKQDGDPASSLAVVRQDALESLLETALAQAGVHVHWRHEVPLLVPGSDHVEAAIDRFEKESRGYVVAHTEWVIAKSIDLRVPFVIGADGYNSRVRRALRIDFPEVGPAQYFAVFEFKTDAQLGGETRIVFGPRTTDVLWPLPEGNCRWSFELPDYRNPRMEESKESFKAAGFDIPTERTKERMASYGIRPEDELDEAGLRALIAARAPWFTGSIENLVWRSIVRFERRLASSFGSGRMWLAGDSAHLTGPIGVQSMNLGLQEASELADIIAGIIRKGHSMDRLDAYNRHWTGVWRQLHGMGVELKLRDAGGEWAVQHAGQLLACLPAYGSAMPALAAQLGLTLQAGAGAAAV